MRKILALIFTFIVFDALACRAPYRVNSSIIEFQYLEEKGTYRVIAPAFVGQSTIGPVNLVFTKQGVSPGTAREEKYEINGQTIEQSWIGNLRSMSLPEQDSWIEVTWYSESCPTIAIKKVQLFEIST